MNSNFTRSSSFGLGLTTLALPSILSNKMNRSHSLPTTSPHIRLPGAFESSITGLHGLESEYFTEDKFINNWSDNEDDLGSETDSPIMNERRIRGITRTSISSLSPELTRSGDEDCNTPDSSTSSSFSFSYLSHVIDFDPVTTLKPITTLKPTLVTIESLRSSVLITQESFTIEPDSPPRSALFSPISTSSTMESSPSLMDLTSNIIESTTAPKIVFPTLPDVPVSMLSRSRPTPRPLPISETNVIILKSRTFPRRRISPSFLPLSSLRSPRSANKPFNRSVAFDPTEQELQSHLLTISHRTQIEHQLDQINSQRSLPNLPTKKRNLWFSNLSKNQKKLEKKRKINLKELNVIVQVESRADLNLENENFIKSLRVVKEPYTDWLERESRRESIDGLLALTA